MPLATRLGLPKPLFQQKFYFTESIFSDNKAANTGIKQLNFINMPKYAYMNGCNTFFCAFLEFGSISKNFHCRKSHSLLQDPGPA